MANSEAESQTQRLGKCAGHMCLYAQKSREDSVGEETIAQMCPLRDDLSLSLSLSFSGEHTSPIAKN